MNKVREPVKTNVLSLNSSFSSTSCPKYLVLIPISISSSTMALLCESLKYSTMLFAIIDPMAGILVNYSSDEDIREAKSL